MKNKFTYFSMLGIFLLSWMFAAQADAQTGCTADFSYQQEANTPTYKFKPVSPASNIGVVSWLWKFGDGSSSSEQFPLHTFAQSGTYTVCLTIATADGCTATSCQTITVGPVISPCQAQFGYTQTASSPLTLYFKQILVNPAVTGAWFWNFGDGTSSTEMNPTHTFAQPGTYTVCLTIATADGCTATSCQTITVGAFTTLCSAKFGYLQASNNALSFQFKQISANTSLSVVSFWDFGDGTTSTEMNPVHTYSQPGTYTVCLTITTSNGCTDKTCKTITAGPGIAACTVKFEYEQTSNNALSFQFKQINLNSSLAVVSFWDFGDGSTSTETNPAHTYAQPGTYTVCLTIATPDGCTAKTCKTITAGPVASACHVKFIYTQTAANALTFKFTQISAASTVLGSSFWDFGDGTTSNEPNPLHTFAQAGTYTVCLKVIYPNGCIASNCQQVTAGDPGPALCAAKFLFKYIGNTGSTTGNQVAFINTSTGTTPATVYAWDFGDGTSSSEENPVHVFTTAGEHTVCLKIVDPANICNDQFCLVVHSQATPNSMLLPLKQDGQAGEKDVFIINYPNPVKSSATTLQYELAADAAVTIEVYNQFGLRTLQIVKGLELKGPKSQEILLNKFRPGIYLVRMKVGDQTFVKKIEVID